MSSDLLGNFDEVTSTGSRPVIAHYNLSLSSEIENYLFFRSHTTLHALLALVPMQGMGRRSSQTKS